MRLRKKKRVSYELLAPMSDVGQPMYRLLEELLTAHHEELVDARIALAWHTGWKPDVDGHVTLGQCKKASDLDRELAPYDFVILLRKDFWTHPTVTAAQRRALLDHELCHATVAYDEHGEPKVDERGRTVYRVRKHDLEEFQAIVERHGLWKRDLESFARAIRRAGAETHLWPGFEALREQLTELRLNVPIETIRTWTEHERRAVRTWAILMAGDGDSTRLIRVSTEHAPPCLQAALGEEDHASA